jgi:succinyl-CoA synthetase beta subunit
MRWTWQRKNKRKWDQWCKSWEGLDEVVDFAQKILGGTLVTLQTGPAGKVVHKILVAQDMYYDGPTERKEFYLSILLDRSKGQNVFMYSTEGGMNIEEVAHNTPEKIFKEWVHPAGFATLPGKKDSFQFRIEW